MSRVRALLVLGRVSNLSTVWANGLCAWAIAGSGAWMDLVALLAGMSFLYVGGMYLNDWCDLDFDRQYRPERPIPSGVVSRGFVFGAVILFFCLGLALVSVGGLGGFGYGVGLVVLIVLYNVIHKKTAAGVPVMAACRVFIYPVVASAAAEGVTLWVWVAGILMFFYVMGITALARGEAKEAGGGRLGMLLLFSPLAAGVGIMLGTDAAGATLAFTALTVVLALVWIVISRLRARVGGKLAVGELIGPLLAGICLVDLVILSSLGSFNVIYGGVMGAFFVIALVAQRKIPAS